MKLITTASRAPVIPSYESVSSSYVPTASYQWKVHLENAENMHEINYLIN